MGADRRPLWARAWMPRNAGAHGLAEQIRSDELIYNQTLVVM